MPQEINWTDAEEIGIQLSEKFPGEDPLTVRFTDLRQRVLELPLSLTRETEHQVGGNHDVRHRGAQFAHDLAVLIQRVTPVHPL